MQNDKLEKLQIKKALVNSKNSPDLTFEKECDIVM